MTTVREFIISVKDDAFDCVRLYLYDSHRSIIPDLERLQYTPDLAVDRIPGIFQWGSKEIASNDVLVTNDEDGKKIIAIALTDERVLIWHIEDGFIVEDTTVEDSE